MKFKEFNFFKTPAYLAEDYEDFMILIEKALNKKNREEYIEFAKANTWEERYKDIIKELYSR